MAVLELVAPPSEPKEAKEDRLIAEAILILENRLKSRHKRGDHDISSPSDAKNLVKLAIAGSEHEQFLCLWLDGRHRLLDWQVVAEGTLDGASVYPREVVKAALAINAGAVIFAHNHPSGVPEPSQADRHITRRLKDALALIEVRVLDHLVVGEDETVSFAERGLI